MPTMVEVVIFVVVSGGGGGGAVPVGVGQPPLQEVTIIVEVVKLVL